MKNKKLLIISTIYISVIILFSLFFIVFNKRNDNNVNESPSAEESLNKPISDEKYPFNQDIPIDPISGEHLIPDDKNIRTVQLPENVRSVRLLGQKNIFDNTSISSDKVLDLKILYNKLALDKGHDLNDTLDVRIYKDSPIESQQTNDSITYTFKTYIDGKDYYSQFTYDINDKVNLKILTEDKTRVLHEYSN